MAAGPGPIKAHVPGIYRFTATALGASMWFFLMYRAKKDGIQDNPDISRTNECSHFTRSRPPRMETSLGSLSSNRPSFKPQILRSE
ncbi:hypothetical protein GGR50DRAFT_668383 [Xylaria sp. CBS 124048]|nr:hypothetical protein GGR50DRAFT_668383 [Xylaria sp. CBS 124048]